MIGFAIAPLLEPVLADLRGWRGVGRQLSFAMFNRAQARARAAFGMLNLTEASKPAVLQTMVASHE